MKKLLWLIPLIYTAVPCALFAQTDSGASASDLALPAMPHPLTPVPEIGHVWTTFPASQAPTSRPTPQVEGNGLIAPIQNTGMGVPSPQGEGSTLVVPIPEKGIGAPSPTPQADGSGFDNPGIDLPVPSNATPESTPTPTPVAKTSSHSNVELDVALGGQEGLDGGQGLGWGGSVACYGSVSPDLALGGSLGFYALNSQVVTDNTYTSVPPSSPSTSPGQDVLSQTNTRLQVLGSAKLTAYGSELGPYLLAGLGVAFVSNTGMDSETVSGNTVASHSLPDNTQTCAVGEAGVGLKIPIAQALNLLLEMKVDLLYDLNGGTTSTYLPFQAGLGFDL